MATLLHKIHANHTILSAARFAVVGMVGTMVDFTLFFAIQMFFNLPILAANSISYSAGIVNNYYLHRSWTFAVRAHKAMGRQFAMFVMISLTALIINSVVVHTLKPFLAMDLTPSMAALLAKIFAIGVSLYWNFFANRFWTFRP